MEFLTILLSSLMGLLSPSGVVVDRVLDHAIRDRLDSVETLAVRVDSTPSYHLLQGQADRVRIAGRGLFPMAGMRIEALEMETDAIALNPEHLGKGRSALERPLQAGVRMVLNRVDLNQALRSPEIIERFQDLSLDALGTSAQQLRRYAFVDPHVDFLPDQRLRLQVTLQEEETNQQLRIRIESGLQVSAGRRLQLVDPVIDVNDNPIAPEFTRQLAQGISDRLDLQRLEPSGITLRILHFQMDADQLAIAAFIQVRPD